MVRRVWIDIFGQMSLGGMKYVEKSQRRKGGASALSIMTFRTTTLMGLFETLSITESSYVMLNATHVPSDMLNVIMLSVVVPAK
jgi:hypothetical protein